MLNYTNFENMYDIFTIKVGILCAVSKCNYFILQWNKIQHVKFYKKNVFHFENIYTTSQENQENSDEISLMTLFVDNKNDN